MVRYSVGMALIENQRAGFEGAVYRLNDEERADIREGLVEIERGEVASDADVREMVAKLKGMLQ